MGTHTLRVPTTVSPFLAHCGCANNANSVAFHSLSGIWTVDPHGSAFLLINLPSHWALGWVSSMVWSFTLQPLAAWSSGKPFRCCESKCSSLRGFGGVVVMTKKCAFPLGMRVAKACYFLDVDEAWGKKYEYKFVFYISSLYSIYHLYDLPEVLRFSTCACFMHVWTKQWDSHLFFSDNDLPH